MYLRLKAASSSLNFRIIFEFTQNMCFLLLLGNKLKCSDSLDAKNILAIMLNIKIYQLSGL